MLVWSHSVMESSQSVFPRGAVCRKLSVDDLDVRNCRRSSKRRRRHNNSGNQTNGHYKLKPMPSEVLSCSVNHSSWLSRRELMSPSPFCTTEKNNSFWRSASTSPITINGLVYAGARFSEAPSPKLLPLPPRHWLDGGNVEQPAVCGEMTRHLKSVLRVE